MLSSLEIKNFRAFSHLSIERLGQVNLIVGKNDVGKTTLLEALRLYSSISPPDTIASILHGRNELAVSSSGKRLLLLHYHWDELHAYQVHSNCGASSNCGLMTLCIFLKASFQTRK